MVELIDYLPLLLLMLAIGAFAGVIAGLLGVGGGIVLVPAFHYAFSSLGHGSEQLMQICIATSLATIVLTSMRSILAHSRKGAVDWAILKSWAPGIVFGAVLGVVVAAQLRSSVLQGIFGLFALGVGLYMGFGREGWRIGLAMPSGILRAILSPFLGFLSVLMGIGGGSFGVPVMTLYSVPIHRAVATAAGFGLIIAVPSVVGFLLLDIAPENRPPFTVGAVNVVAFLVTISMTLMSAPIGARMAHAINGLLLRRVFAAFLMLVAVNMLRLAAGF